MNTWLDRMLEEARADAEQTKAPPADHADEAPCPCDRCTLERLQA